MLKFKFGMLLQFSLIVFTIHLFFQAGCGKQMGTFMGGNHTSGIGGVSNEHLTKEQGNFDDTTEEVSRTKQTLDQEALGSEIDPPAPCTGDFDWIQFRNGEWLKGEIQGLQYDKFSFDSDELDTLQLDWDDIYAVCSTKQNTYVFEDRSSVLGTFRVEGDAITIVTSEGGRRYKRADLDSIIPGGLTEWDYWSGKLSLGLAVRSGNTHQSDASSYLTLQRRSPGLRTLFEYTSNYGSYEGAETINNQQTYLRHDIFVSRKVYLVTPIVAYYRDKFQNIDYRLTPGAGLGYQLIDKGDVVWDVAGGGGYQYTRFSQVEFGENSSEGGGALLAGTNLTWDLTKKLDLKISYRTTFGLSETVSDTHHALVMFSVDVWKDVDLDVSFTWDRLEDPKSRDDGSRPDRDDFRMNLGIGWKF